MNAPTAKRWRTLASGTEDYDYSDIAFCELDLGDTGSLASALSGCDLVVHTAGPFQRKNTPEVLEAAIEAKVRTTPIRNPSTHFSVSVFLSVVYCRIDTYWKARAGSGFNPSVVLYNQPTV